MFRRRGKENPLNVRVNINDLELIEMKAMVTKKATATVFKVGDQVKLKAGVKKVEVNGFENYRQSYYFEPEDVATVFGVDLPRLQHEPGHLDTQTVVRFEKIGFKRVLAQLAATVETSDLVLIQK